VSFLDLRRANVAEALDWILQPVRMTWRPSEGRIVAGTDRRLAGESAWVYDVSMIALPSVEELQKLGDYQKAVAAAKKAAGEFLAAVRTELGADETAVVWFAPGQLLVTGDAARHAQAAKLFTALAEGPVKPRGAAAQLYATTRKRAEERRELAAKLAWARRRFETAARHETFGWQLLAAAADGRLDLEALTELKIAWRSPVTAELLSGPGAAAVLRSLWVVCESSQLLPQEQELGALADWARARCRPATQATVAALRKDPADGSALLGTLYGALALRDARLAAEARTLLAKAEAEDSPLGAARTVARALMSEPEAIDRAALAQVIAGEHVHGEDLVVLAALACRRAGEQLWTAFRAESRELLGDQPLDGNVVLLVNRLSRRKGVRTLFSSATGVPQTIVARKES
jgi:hypothetical protein